MTKTRKLQLLNRFNTNIPDIPQKKLDRIKRDYAKFIFVHDKAGHCTCQRCGGEFVAKTTHKREVKCPECGKKLTAHHEWRGTNGLDFVDWSVIPYVMAEDTVMLRYVMAWADSETNKMCAEERARLVITDKLKDNLTFEYRPISEEWVYSSRAYFSSSNYYYGSRWLCIYGDLFPVGSYKELRKLKGLKYFDELKSLAEPYMKRYAVHQVIYTIMKKCVTYEKLYKVGLEDMCKKDFGKNSLYDKDSLITRIDPDQRSVIKMLGLNKNTFALLKKYKDIRALDILKALSDVKEEEFDKLYKSGMDIKVLEYISSKLSWRKAINYITKKNIVADEYKFYLENLEKAKYPFDKAYLFPRDFYAMDLKVAEDAEVSSGKYSRIKRAKQSVFIRKISEAMRSSEAFKEFFAGTNGLQVVLPDSVGELKREGRLLHNCIGGYGQRIATGKTLVFFVREISNPTAPYVAVEYKDGRIIQIRADHNKQVENTNVLQFVKSFTDTMKQAQAI